MKRLLFMIVILMISDKSLAEQEVVFEHLEKPRVIVLTDITNEPDDEQSMVRFLVYSNEYDVEGLIATTSVWLRDKVRVTSSRLLTGRTGGPLGALYPKLKFIMEGDTPSFIGFYQGLIIGKPHIYQPAPLLFCSPNQS